ncbi:MAG: (d)CMP kinase, partial [Mycoplasmataceae bacterium]|nr:(d)CMP kinase [Mycoplasmataceae bacterium]
EDVTKEVRADVVSSKASIVASISNVREWAVTLQQQAAESKGVVMDGRDTTFVVLPNADIKIFLDTDVKVRAKRRQEQNEKLGFSTNYDKVLKELEVRDHRDRTREKDPLHKTEDAILIDSSKISLEDVVKKISRLVSDKIKELS